MRAVDVVAASLYGKYGAKFPRAHNWDADAEFVLERFQEYGWVLAATPPADTALPPPNRALMGTNYGPLDAPWSDENGDEVERGAPG